MFVRNPLEFRDYSPVTGLSALQSMPFEVFAATNNVVLLASVYGISAVWNYPPDIDVDIVSAVQSFLP